MKILTMLLSLALLAGCTIPNKLNKAKARYLCRDNGGLHRLDKISEYPVVCRDGTKFTITALEVVIIKDPEYLPE